MRTPPIDIKAVTQIILSIKAAKVLKIKSQFNQMTEYFPTNPHRINTIQSFSSLHQENRHQYNVLRIVSFDIGVKHLSMCIADCDNNKYDFAIKRWVVVSLKGKNIFDYTANLVEKLKEENFGCVDYLLIEQQMNRNTQMKVLSHVIQTFFLTDVSLPKDRIIFVPAQNRFKPTKISQSSNEYILMVENSKESLGISGDKMNRSDYKKLSVEVTRRILSSRNVDGDRVWISNFLIAKKRDDLADSFLQIMTWYLDFAEAFNDVTRQAIIIT